MKREIGKLIADAIFGPLEAWKILFLLTVGLAVDWSAGSNRLISVFPYSPWVVWVAVLILWWIVTLMALANRAKRTLPKIEDEADD